MKKIVLIAAVAALGVASCKKDRVCNCKEVYYKNGSVTYAGDAYDKTLKDASYRTAFRACTHTKTNVTDGADKYEYDVNCSLK